MQLQMQHLLHSQRWSHSWVAGPQQLTQPCSGHTRAPFKHFTFAQPSCGLPDGRPSFVNGMNTPRSWKSGRQTFVSVYWELNELREKLMKKKCNNRVGQQPIGMNGHKGGPKQIVTGKRKRLQGRHIALKIPVPSTERTSDSDHRKCNRPLWQVLLSRSSPPM